MSTTTLRDDDDAVTPPAKVPATRQSRAILRPEMVTLLLLLVLCAALRVVNLGALPLFIDEGTYAQAARIVGARPGPDTLFILSAHNFGSNPPLFSWLAAPFTRFVPDPLLAARLASACIGTLGLVATWAVGRALRGPRAGLLAGLLYALSPFVLFYNRMAMLDGLLATCGAGALFFALRLRRRARARDAVCLGLCVAAGMLTKLFAVNLLLLPLLAAALAERPRRDAARRGAAVAIALGVLPLFYVYQNGSGLHGHLNPQGLAPALWIVWGQAVAWGQTLWLYLTPPVILCALVGLWTARREQSGLLVGLWAVLGTITIVATPNTLFAPRYVLYSAVPIVVLGARGLLALAEALYRPLPASLGARTPLWLLGAAVTLVSLPAAAADATTVGAPLQASLIPFDRWQYTTGWPSGATLAPDIAYLHKQAARRPITVVSEDIPLYMLEVALYGDTNITWNEANFDHPDALRAILRDAARTAGASNLYVVDHHTSGPSPDRRLQPAGRPLLADRPLTVLVSSHGPDGVSIYEVYGVATRRSHCHIHTLFGVSVESCKP